MFSIKKLGYISDLFIDEKYRRKGVSSEFQKRAFKWFKTKGIKYAEIAVYPANKKAVNIYRKWGFNDFHLILRKKL